MTNIKNGEPHSHQTSNKKEPNTHKTSNKKNEQKVKILNNSTKKSSGNFREITPDSTRKSKSTNKAKEHKVLKSNNIKAGTIIPDKKKSTAEPSSKKTKDKSEKKNNRKTLWIVLASVFGVLFLSYLVGVVYFHSHFLLNMQINGQNFSGKPVQAVRDYMTQVVNQYSLTIIERDDASDRIDGSEIQLTFRDDGQIQSLLENQNQWLWPISFFRMIEEATTMVVDFNQEALQQQINQIQAVTAEQIPPTNATIVFDGDTFVIEPEVYGTAVKMAELQDAVIHAITNFDTELNMVEQNLYVLPEHTTESEEVIRALAEANHYASASITYPMDEAIVVDGRLISTWMTISDTYEVVLHEDLIAEWVNEFADTYTTAGTTRSFTTPRGRDVTLTSRYGWNVDAEATLEILVEHIRAGDVVEIEPEYTQRAISHGARDWGDTFIQVDLANQVMWYIVDGEIALESNIVTGLANTTRVTPTGIFTIIEKDTNRYLRGPRDPETGEFEWESFVNYWMRITWGGIGFHDASWQTSFGGNRFRTHGSRGCINMPLDQARRLFNMLPMGTPVVIHN